LGEESKMTVKEPTTQQRRWTKEVNKQIAAQLLDRGVYTPSDIAPKWTNKEIGAINKWISENAPALSRGEAIRRLVEIGLKAKA
jgi:hypothetical protein